MTISILHISDLHLSFNKGRHDQNIVLNAFLSDIEILSKTKKIDLIFFTGDLVGKGVYPEEPLAAVREAFIDRLLDICNLSADFMVFCPGNHDAEMQAKNKYFEQGIAGTLISKDAVNNFVDSHEEELLAFNSLEKYRKVSSQFGVSSRVKETPMYSSYVFDIRGQKIGIGSLNSAWRATGRSEDGDYAELIVGERQVELSAMPLQKCDVKVALMHHPLIWLAKFDTGPVTRALSKNFDVLFYGHVHEPGGVAQITPGQNLIMCGAGCLYQHRDYYNGYSIVEINKNENSFKLIAREYIEQRGGFDECLRLGPKGEFTTPLKGTGNESFFVVPESNLEELSEKVNGQLISRSISEMAPTDIMDIFVEPRLSLEPMEKLESETQPNQKNLLSISLLEDDKKNYFIWGGKESGKTTLLNYLSVLIMRKSSLSGSFGFYIDARSLSKNQEIVTSLAIFSDNAFKRREIENLLDQGRAMIAFDNMPIDNTDVIYQKIKKFVGKYSNCKYLFSGDYSHFRQATPEEQRDIKIGIDYTNIYLLPFTRKQARQLITKWFSDTSIETDAILDDILALIRRLQLPRSPFLLTILIWLNEKKLPFSPVNHAALIENFIEGILEKLQDSNFRSDNFDYRTKQHFLSELAAHLSTTQGKKISRLELEHFAVSYFQDRGQKTSKPSQLLDLLFRRGVLVEVGEEVRFKLDCFGEYFVAKKMFAEPDYLSECTSSDNYLKYSNELDYYSGLKRDDLLLLKLIETYLDASYDKLGLPITADDYVTFELDESSYTNKINGRLNELFDSRPTFEQRELMLDHFDEIHVGQVNSDVKTTEGYELDVDSKASTFLPEFVSAYVDHFVTLDLTSRILRNSELVKDTKLKDAVFHKSMEYWSRNAIFGLVQFENILKQNKTSEHKDGTEDQQLVKAKYFSQIFIPTAFQMMLVESMGTAKLKDTMEAYIADNSNPQLSSLFALCIYSELALPGYLNKLEDFVESRQLTRFSMEILFFRLLSFYFFKNLPKSDHARLESILSLVFSKMNGLKSGDDVAQKRSYFINNIQRKLDTYKRVSPDSVRDK